MITFFTGGSVAGVLLLPEDESVRCEVGGGRRPGVGVGGGLLPGVAGGGTFLPDAVAAAGGVVGEDGHEAGFRLCFSIGMALTVRGRVDSEGVSILPDFLGQ